MKTITLCLLLLNFSCSKEYYDYHGEKILIYKKIDHSTYLKGKGIDLSNNGLTKLPKEIEKMKNLLFINLRNNSLHSINSLLSLKNIRVLILDENPLGQIPPSIDSLTDLEVLSVRACHLSTLPSSLFRLKNLKTIVLGGNQIPDHLIQELKEQLPQCKVIVNVD